MLRFMESCEWLTTSDIDKKWSFRTGTVSIDSGGRFGNGMFFADDNSRFAYINNPGGMSSDVVIVGLAYRYTGIGDNSYFLRLREQGVGDHVTLRINSSSALLQARNAGGTVLGTGTTALTNNIWYYVEIKVKVHDTLGTVEVRVNDNVEFALTGQDTRNGGAGVIDQVYFLGQGGFGSGNWYLDDMYICDDDASASGCDDFLGDVRVECLHPTGNGATSDFLGSDADSTNNYLLVDESAQNGDTDYVEDDVVGDKDTYAYSDLTATAATIYGVQILPLARKTDAGARSIASVAREGGGTEEDGPDRSLGTTYLYKMDIREEKPSGGVWGISDVNSAEFGQKVTV